MTELFEDFSASNAQAWKDRLTKDLKGVTFEDLSVQDRNQITIRPFYTPDVEGTSAQISFTHQDWAICEAIVVEDAATANKKALQVLQNGASGLCFELSAETDLNVLLQGIELPYIYTQFKVQDDTPAFMANWQNWLNGRNMKSTDLNSILITDPVGQAILNGDNQNENTKEQFLTAIASTGTCTIDATIYQNAGANSSTQLAYIIAQLNEYLNWLHEAGKINDLKKVYLACATGTDFFEEIAKLRALRILLNNLLEQYYINPDIHLHVETSDTYRASFDRYSNLLRDTLAGMAGILGGCHSLLIHAFDHNEDSEFSSRMSRNQQLVLKEESYLHQVSDVSSGSFYLEKLSAQLAEEAWKIFQEIELGGGFIAASEEGRIKETIEAQANQWIQEYKEGKRILIGINKYVNAGDKPVPTSNIPAPGKGLNKVKLAEQLA